MGALGGLATLVVGGLSFWQWKRNKWIPVLSWLIVFGMGFQAAREDCSRFGFCPSKFHSHGHGTRYCGAAPLPLLYFKTKKWLPNPSKLTKQLAVIALVLTLIQIAMGTQVRQFVDEQINRLGEEAHALWLDPAPLLFYVHRSFSFWSPL